MDDVVLWIVVGTALAFDFTNGFHDTANAVATSISTRALSPRLAVAIEFAVSWKPLVKSNASAVPTTMITVRSSPFTQTAPPPTSS